MKFPSDFQIVGENVILIPYKESHVEKYHGWMSDPEILRLTGSESLTLEQEQDMQKEWERDDKKCTFIIMDKFKFEESQDEISSIVGDTNLFFMEHNDNENSDGNDKGDEAVNRTAEIEVMIGENWARRKGLAKEALQLMIDFGIRELKKTGFIAKIKCDNQPSIQLFEKLGFKQKSLPNVFNEIGFELDCSSS